MFVCLKMDAIKCRHVCTKLTFHVSLIALKNACSHVNLGENKNKMETNGISPAAK